MNKRALTVSKEKSKNEKRIVKPSTELVPDEYEVLFNGKECVHVFVADKDQGQEYEKFLKELNIEVPESNIHSMESDKEIETTLKRVADSQKETSLLLVLFWGYSLEDGKFTLEDESTIPYYRIWTPFLTTSNENFRDKPKVFFFNAIKSKKIQETDALLFKESTSPYEVPNEADLLIIYKHNNDYIESITFIRELAELLKTYGMKEDLCSVVTIVDTSYYTRPVIISTLLKKFYMFPSQLRGHHLSFELNHRTALEELRIIEDILIEAEKPQGSPSIIKKISKRFSSFRRGNHDKVSIKEESKVEIQPKAETSTTESVTRKPSKDTVPRPSFERPVRKLSTSKVQGKKHWIP